MIYSLILLKHYNPFATVRIKKAVKAGDKIKFKDLLYNVIYVDGFEITVTV